MIPKRFIRVWIGPRNIRKIYEKWWGWFEQLHPDWEMLTIRDDQVQNFLSGKISDLFLEQWTWAGRVDVLRLAILHQIGGVYVDVDVMPVKPFDPLLEDERPFVGHAGPHSLQNAVIGAPAGHPAVEQLIDGMPEWYEKYPSPDKAAGPRYVTEQWWDRDDVRRLSRRAFYFVPRITYPEFERTALFTAGAYAAHHGLGSWWHGHWGGTVPESQRKIPEKKVK